MGRVTQKIGWILLLLCALLFLSPNLLVQAMSIYVKDGQVRQVVQGIGKSNHLDIIGSEHLTGTIDIALKEVVPREAIRKIAQAKGIAYVEDKEAFIFLGKEEKASYEAYFLSPHIMTAQALGKALTAIVPQERIKIVSETNQVILYGNVRDYQQALAVQKHMDKIPKQVMLEVQVLSLQEEQKDQYGVKWERRGKGHSFLPLVFGESYEGKGILLAKPTVMTMNGQEAKILIGDRLPVLVEKGKGDSKSTSIRYEEAGIKLTYTPHIGEDGHIDATILAEVSTPILVPEMKAYRITTRQAKTRVRLRDGEVLRIGGLRGASQVKNYKKIPFLGDIPILGNLFKKTTKEGEKREIVILLKGTVVKEANSLA